MLPPQDEERFIAVVVRKNPNWSNKKHQVGPGTKIGDGLLYKVSFQGEDNEWYENFIFQRGDITTHYYNANDLLARHREIFPDEKNPNLFNQRVVAIIAGSLTAALIAGILIQIDSRGMTLLAGIWGTAFGYFLTKPHAVQKR